jgi:hypothetical protein
MNEKKKHGVIDRITNNMVVIERVVNNKRGQMVVCAKAEVATNVKEGDAIIYNEEKSIWEFDSERTKQRREKINALSEKLWANN